MGSMASQITYLTIVYSSVYSGADQRKHQSSTSLAFVRGIHRRPVTRKMLSFDDVIMLILFPQWYFPKDIYSLTWMGNQLSLLFFLLNTKPFYNHHFNSSPSSDAYMRQWFEVAFALILAWCRIGAKPLSKPMLSYYQLDLLEQTSVKFWSKYKTFHPRKCIWKILSARWWPFCPEGYELIDHFFTVEINKHNHTKLDTGFHSSCDGTCIWGWSYIFAAESCYSIYSMFRETWAVMFCLILLCVCGFASTVSSLEHGPHLNIKTAFPRYGDSHVKEKTVARPSYL